MEKLKPKPEHILMEAFGFDETDLKANQMGRFSRNQYAEFTRRWRTMLVGLVLLSLFSPIALLITVVIQDRQSCGSFFFIAFVSASGWIVLKSQYKGTNADLNSATVRSIEGRIQLDVGGNKGSKMTIQIQNQMFILNKETFLAFKNGDPYIIYYAPNTRRILSAEWLRD